MKGPEAGREFASRFFGVATQDVALVGEEYEPDLWNMKRAIPSALSQDPGTELREVLTALDTENISNLTIIFDRIAGAKISPQEWQKSVYDSLAANELVYQVADTLKAPRPVAELIEVLGQRIGRNVTEEEILIWLALGAASRKDGRPLLRPVVHTFVRGVSGAVVTFPFGSRGPRLWLSTEDAASDGLYRLNVLTCTTCGQHYFEHHLADFHFSDSAPSGGEAIENRVIWRPLDRTKGGRRVVLLDRLVSTAEDDNDEDDTPPPPSTTSVVLCRFCGTVHPADISRCDSCGRESALVQLLAARQKDSSPGYLSSCISCKAIGRQRPGGFREPARPVRAVNVSDVHVLAQNMIQHAERKRLLVFADNRQDAAFQAGWMQDHARRFRLRALMYEQIASRPVSVGDLTAYLDDLLDADDDLSRTLIPEVWQVCRKEAEGLRHGDERRRFLRIQVLREITTGARQRIGLEPWGRMIVDYSGLQPELPFFQTWSQAIGCTPSELCSGVAVLLDAARRAGVLLDREHRVFSRFWSEGDHEILRGYLPLNPAIPRALKLRRDPGDNSGRLQQWLSEKGDTVARQALRRFGLPKDHIPTFFEELWDLLTEKLKLLPTVTLTGGRGNALPQCGGARQIDADRLLLTAHRGIYRCTTCRRGHLRPTPGMVCMAWRCPGTTVFENENLDNYDLMVLDQAFAMLRPREHSAQIPAEDREFIERVFKGDSESLNTLVCTPTLELGVNIGALDAVLMRNVPPKAANYWQRAGRAGRQHRMAVNVTYARAASHDRAYFNDPPKLLEGQIQPPRFNLKNELMIGKHARATVLTELFRLAHPSSSLVSYEQEEVGSALKECLPFQIRDYLFDAVGNIRTAPFSVEALATVVSKHQAHLADNVERVFNRGWPEADADAVRPEVLRDYISSMAPDLSDVILRLNRRLHWALDQMERLDEVRKRKGTLDTDEDALRQRCDRFIKKMKGLQSRRRQEAEGYDDTNTYAVLAAEGFLPGYGLDVGSVLAFHQTPRNAIGMRDWEVRRNTGLAVREYVPGNLIYANGHRFYPRFFHLEPTPPLMFQVDIRNEAITETSADSGGGMGVALLPAVPICDVDLPHQSHITDEEDYRFQLAVSIFGHEQGRHGDGRAYNWGLRTIDFREAVHIRLVNVGAANLVRGSSSLGYPMCLVCGQTRSPLASQADRTNFATDHRERCGQPVVSGGFFANVVADALRIQSCSGREEAYSIAEALRMGAAEVLEMEMDDLQILAIGSPGSPSVDVLLYDPMPGGSGLLEQMLARWPEVIEASRNIVEGCPSQCTSSCVDCLQTFRNAFYHSYLNRHRAADRFKDWGSQIQPTHEIPSVLPSTEKGQLPTDQAEDRLSAMLQRAGFSNAISQYPIDLGKPLGTTFPDFFFKDPTERLDGICLYLDGMSKTIHGDPVNARRDREVREELRHRGYEVFEIPTGNLDDPAAMTRHFYRLGRILLGRDGSDKLKNDQGWFGGASGAGNSST